MGLENYTRLRRLGKGSFGEVFLVEDKRDRCQYVMKEVDLVQFGPKGRKEALKEVGFLNAMNHPFIIRYREFFEQDPTGLGRKMLYIIMEYADGGDLDGRIKAQNGRLFPESLILEWFVQICLAVKHVHDRKTIHRDLKSENIFLMKPNSSVSASSQVKLGDFGISRQMAHTMANAITRIGTPYYLSPEICMNKPYNSKSDLWSLGVVLYEMMSLRHPFDATSMEGLLNKIVKSQPPPLPKQYSIELRTVVDSLLSKQPAKRPTVNSLLRLPFLAAYVQRLLSPAQMADEFSHTVLHSDASARGGRPQPSQPPPMPPPNYVAPPRESAREQSARPASNGVRPSARAAAAAAAPQHQLHAPPSARPRASVYEPVSRGGAGSPYTPASNRPPSSSRASARAYAAAQAPLPPPQVPASAYPPPPASPYAGMSHADKIRAIRERKEQELREARAAQADLARRRQQQQQQPQQQYAEEKMTSEEDARERERAAQRAREVQKERQLAEHARGGAPEYNLQRGGGGGGRGIPSVRPLRDDPSAAPLHGAPYNDRLPPSHPSRGGGGPSSAAEVVRRAREEEVQRMRVRYFKERKAQRETNLRSAQATPASARNPYGQAPRQLAPPPLPVGYVSRPHSSVSVQGGGAGGPIIARHGAAAVPAPLSRRPMPPQPIAAAPYGRETPKWK